MFAYMCVCVHVCVHVCVFVCACVCACEDYDCLNHEIICQSPSDNSESRIIF